MGSIVIVRGFEVGACLVCLKDKEIVWATWSEARESLVGDDEVRGADGFFILCGFVS